MSASESPAMYPPSSELYIGLMSGTSLDGVDGVLAAFGPEGLQVRAYAALPFPAALRAELLALNSASDNELHRAALAGNALSRSYAKVVARLLGDSGTAPQAVRAIGAHGQTVRHQPQLHDGTGYTLQLQNPALLAELSGITVVADFRSRDVAAGGQGAPLVPAFHQGLFADSETHTLVLNIGGIANLSVLPAAMPEGPLPAVQGFDCGPGNALMDAWCQEHRGQPYDADGAWAAGGQVLPALLQRLLAEPFLRQAPPKSTGRDLFHRSWLQQQLDAVAGEGPAPDPQHVQATLTEFTARACADHARAYAADAQELLVCGGGALNGHLMARLQALLPTLQVHSTAARGLPPLQVEAAAFAWLAQQTLNGQAGNLPRVTGARGPRILGAIYPR